MTYQTAYKLLVAAYKSAKGVMPKGLDMLKLKMKARQKVIDSKKVIEFPPDKITPFYKPRPTETEIMMKKTGIPVTVKGKTTTMTPDGILKMLMGKGKGKAAETEAEMIVRMNRQNKESVARLKNKKEKSLGEKLKDYDGDPDGMAGGGKVKKPFKSKVVDFLGGPAVVGAELGLSGLLEIYNILGMPLMKDGGKVKKKRKHNDNIDDEDIGEGKSKERFLRVMPEVDGIPRSDGIMELATGGMTNISDTYDNNPTLQSQYPNKQDYLDLFAQQTTTTTPQINTTTQSPTSTIAPINPIKPIIPIPQDGGDSGGITNIQTSQKNFIDNIAIPGVVTDSSKANQNFRNTALHTYGTPVEEEEISFFDKIKQFSPTYQFMKAGQQLKDRGQQAIQDFFAKKAEEKELQDILDRVAAENKAAGYQDYGSGGGLDPSLNDPNTGEYTGASTQDYNTPD